MPTAALVLTVDLTWLQALVLEAIHTAAYAGQSLGSPLLCPPRKLAAVDAETLLDFQAKCDCPGHSTTVATHCTAMPLMLHWHGPIGVQKRRALVQRNLGAAT